MLLVKIFPLIAILIMMSPERAVGQAFMNPDVQRRDREAIQNAVRKLDRELWRLEIIDNLIDALTYNPQETPSLQLEKITRALLDNAGLCSLCDLERKAQMQAEATRLGQIIIEDDKKRQRDAAISAGGTRPPNSGRPMYPLNNSTQPSIIFQTSRDLPGQRLEQRPTGPASPLMRPNMTTSSQPNSTLIESTTRSVPQSRGSGSVENPRQR